MTITRYTKELFSAKSLNPEVSFTVEDRRGGFEVDAWADNKALLESWRKMYDSLAPARENRIRNKRYLLGDQWGDVIIDPDDKCGNKKITEEEYLKREGFTPLTSNLIAKVVAAIMGAYRSNKREPMAISRDSEEAIVGDMMSVAMQYAYQINEAHEINAHTLKETLISGFAIGGVRFCWNKERRNYEVKITEESLMDMFCNGDVQDIRMNDLRTIGFLRDYSRDELLKDFARDEEEGMKILGYYANHVDKDRRQENPAFNAKYTKENNDFYMCSDPAKYRVIEGWQIEGKWRLRFHDTLEATTGVCELDDKQTIDNINMQRIEEMIHAGGTSEDAALIKYEQFWDEFWVGRYLAPTGEELLRVETPYDHLSHPYTIRCFPMIDGEVHPLIENIRPQQRHINRYITMMDFIRQCSAKGVLIFPKDLAKGQDQDDIAKAWTKANGIIFADLRPGSQMPQQFNSPTVNSGDTELLNIQMQLLEDISGVHAAMVGKSASASTPSSLYAQEAQNASNNLLDVIEWFDGFVRARDYKMMKVIQQFYDTPRYINIGGHEYAEAAKYYNPEKVRNAEMDTAISEAMATPAYRLIIADKLEQLLQQGFIDVEMFLKGSKIPGGDRILAMIESKKQEAAQQEQQMGQGQGSNEGAGEVVDSTEPAPVPTFNDKTAQAQISEALNNGSTSAAIQNRS